MNSKEAYNILTNKVHHTLEDYNEAVSQYEKDLVLLDIFKRILLSKESWIWCGDDKVRVDGTVDFKDKAEKDLIEEIVGE